MKNEMEVDYFREHYNEVEGKISLQELFELEGKNKRQRECEEAGYHQSSKLIREKNDGKKIMQCSYCENVYDG